MRALLVSGLKQETIPHTGLVKFAGTYLTNYECFYTSHADKNFRLEDIDFVVAHSFGGAAVYQKLQMFKLQQVIKAVFFDTVEEHWHTENLDVAANVHGVSVIKEPEWWWLVRRFPPASDIKGPNMQTMRYHLDHNAIVNSDNVQYDVATVMGLREV